MENDIIGMVWNLSVHNIVIAYCCAITEKLSSIPKNTRNDNDFSTHYGIDYHTFNT
jgi:hypothetical protein